MFSAGPPPRKASSQGPVRPNSRLPVLFMLPTGRFATAMLPRRTLPSILLVLCACAPSYSTPVAPKPVAAVSVGDRLRVTHTSECCPSPAIGTATSMSPDSLVLQSSQGMRLSLGRSSITRIERWNARGRTHKAAGAALGLLGGAAIVGFIGYQSGCAHCDGDWRPLGALLGVIVGGGTGLLAGIVVGAQHRGFWETLP
jgi:hypothetical protein